MRKVIALASALGLVASAGYAAAAARVGKKAPAFSLKDENGNKHSLEKYRGKVVVLEWTNPQCPFVKRHYRAKTMQVTKAAFPGKKVVWLAVNSSHFNKPSDSASWKREQKLRYHTLQDPSGTVGRAYGAKTTPHMFVIDDKGVLRYNGAIDDDPYGNNKKKHNYVRGGVSRLLAKKLPKPGLTQPYGCSVKYKR